ncbi:hypothetical protein BRC87_12835 [Halobacteriales archaeon QS_4_66_20]|nr:MAG: hypothetical protein BRC87_12835 [Halobacteriales archaeon QS_4_66_20]
MAEEQSQHSPDEENPPEDAAESDETEVATECVDAEAVDDEHLEELPDGSGCVEVWERLAERRGDGE